MSMIECLSAISPVLWQRQHTGDNTIVEAIPPDCIAWLWGSDHLAAHVVNTVIVPVMHSHTQQHCTVVQSAP